MTNHIKTINKHKAEFTSRNNANRYLELADSFLENHPEILYWTERNDSKKGVFYKYDTGVYRECSSFEVENMLQNYEPKENNILVPRAITECKFQETMRIIKRRRFFHSDLFNQEHIINFKNGLLDIKTGTLLPHTMDIISTVQLPYEYNKSADCPLFMKLVNESLEGDLAKICILQEFMGYCLIKSTKFEKALFLVGAARTGKSTILDSVEYVLGEENCSSIRMDMLCDSRFTGNLINKYVNIDNEIPYNMSNYEESLKKIISGQKITINTKFIPTYDAKPFCKLIFAANDLPRVSDTSDGVFRRILLLSCNNVVDEDKIDVNLKHKIKKECSGMFNWAFEGLKRLIKNDKFTISTDMVEQVNEFKLLNNSVYYFISENFDVTGDHKDYIEVEMLYEEYKDFCHKVGARGIFKKNIFGKELKKVYVKKVESDRKNLSGSQRRCWLGLKRKGLNSNEREGLKWDE